MIPEQKLNVTEEVGFHLARALLELQCSSEVVLKLNTQFAYNSLSVSMLFNIKCLYAKVKAEDRIVFLLVVVLKVQLVA